MLLADMIAPNLAKPGEPKERILRTWCNIAGFPCDFVSMMLSYQELCKNLNGIQDGTGISGTVFRYIVNYLVISRIPLWLGENVAPSV